MTDHPWSADFDDLRVFSLAMQNKQALSYNGIEAGVITGLQKLFATALKTEPQGYGHIVNTIVS